MGEADGTAGGGAGAMGMGSSVNGPGVNDGGCAGPSGGIS